MIKDFMNKVFVSSNLGVKAKACLKGKIPFKQAIVPGKPSNLRYELEGDKCTILWDAVVGASKYNIYLDGELLAKVETNSYETTHELFGEIQVEPYNPYHLGELSDALQVKTKPNCISDLVITPTREGNDWLLDVTFTDNSLIEDGFTISYKLDDEDAWITRNLVKFNGQGETKYTVLIPSVEKYASIKVGAYNDIGASESPITTIYTTNDFLWSYDPDTARLLLAWYNTNEYFDRFVINYSINNGTYRQIEVLNTWDLDELITYYLQVALNSTTKVSITAYIGDNAQFPTSTKNCSEALDVNLYAPSDFTQSYASQGVAQFSWLDSYTVDTSYEIHYILDGQDYYTEINALDVEGTGSINSFLYDFEGYAGNLQVRVRMKWLLGYSAWTDFITIDYIPVSGLPPRYYTKEFTDEGIRFEWEPLSYVVKYEIYVTINGEEQILETLASYYNLRVDFEESTIIEFKVRVHYLGDVISDFTEPMVLNVVATSYKYNTIVHRIEDANPYTYEQIVYGEDIPVEYPFSTITYITQSYPYNITSSTYQQYVMNSYPYSVTIRGYQLASSYPFRTTILTNDAMRDYPLYMVTSAIDQCGAPINSTIATYIQLEYRFNVEINKVRILCIGDSITAGHPNYWAETQTGNEQSQYEYWLNRRLKGAYEIINKGYGSDTTDRLLARFNRDVFPYNPTYVIIQIGTNDLYWAMAENNGDQAHLDRKLQVMKDNTLEMIKRVKDAGIIPIIGTLIPRTGATGIYKQALYDYNEWIIQTAQADDKLEFIDFFNAGKDLIPPEPLEDPNNPGAMNPMMDGDAIYDEYGQLVKQGRGIHPSVDGYRVMAYAIPLSLFSSIPVGLKLYLDEDCTLEAPIDDTDPLNPYYTLSLTNLRLNKPKTIVYYIKTVGSAQTMYALFTEKSDSINIVYYDANDQEVQYASGTLSAEKATKVTMDISLTEAHNVELRLILLGREIKY